MTIKAIKGNASNNKLLNENPTIKLTSTKTINKAIAILIPGMIETFKSLPFFLRRNPYHDKTSKNKNKERNSNELSLISLSRKAKEENKAISDTTNNPTQ